MLKRANISWNARQLSKMIEKGSITFDSAVQRGLVWDNDRKSLLIHSMMTGFPIPAMYAAKDNETKILSMLDGKQRSNAISDFLHGRFTLSNVPEVVLEDGTEVDVNGMYFSGLDEELQDIISNYSLTIYYFEDISEDEINELFFRLNNGKPLTTYEKYRAKSKSLPEIQRVAAHDYFKIALKEKALANRDNENWVLKSYIMLTFKEPCLDAKVTNPTWENAVLTEDDINNLNAVYDRILNVYNILIADDSVETGKISKKVAKRLISRTHMFCLIPIVKRSIDENVSDEIFSLWAKNFFCGTKSATKYNDYNIRCNGGTGHAETIRVKLSIIKKDYDKFMKKFQKETENNVEVVDDANDVEEDLTVVTDIVTDDNVETNTTDTIETDTETDSVTAA